MVFTGEKTEPHHGEETAGNTAPGADLDTSEGP